MLTRPDPADAHQHVSKLSLPVQLFLTITMGSLIIFSAIESEAQTTPPKPAAARPAPAKPATPAATPAATSAAKPVVAEAAAGEAQPVSHARAAAVTACLPAISELSRLTLDAPHMAMSTWNKSNANGHMFSSIVGLKYDNNIAPRALAVLSAAPNGRSLCDGETIQVQPSSLACDVIQKNLIGAGLKTSDLNGVSMIQGDGPIRFALMPTSGNGCTVVSIGSYYGQ